MKAAAKLGLCPTFPDHGRLCDDRGTGGRRYVCIHAGHRRREYDDQPELRRCVWSTEELQAMGVLP